MVCIIKGRNRIELVFTLVLLFFAIGSIVFIGLLGTGNLRLSPLELPREKIVKLVDLSIEVQTNEEKIDFIYAYLTAILDEQNRQYDIQVLLSDIRFYFVITPLILIIIVIGYLFISCYPLRVFSWGDYENHHNKLIEKRKNLWNIVVFSMVIGVLGNLFVFGLSSFFQN